MMHSEQINELAAALAKAQGQIKGALRLSKNPFFKSAYSDLSSIWDACREPLSVNGLAVVQAPSITEDGRVSVTTLLLHASGQWIQETVSVMPKDDGPQAMGSVTTYLKRYSLAAVVGVTPEDDDDAEAAEGRPVGRKTAAMVEPIPEAPPGYAQWLVSYEAVVPFGAVALRAAFQKAKIAYREFLVKHDRERHEAMKAAAALHPAGDPSEGAA
jgi:ERF superfamily